MKPPPGDAGEFPLRFAADAHFQRVAALLRDAPYTEDALLSGLGINRLSELDAAARRDPSHHSLLPLQHLLVHLFLFVRTLPCADVEQLIDSPVLESLLALDLLRRATFLGQEGEHYYAPVMLYPVSGCFVVSDRHDTPDGSPFAPPRDVVFPAIYAGTLRFLELLPMWPVGDALDLGAGSGAAAFVLSRCAARAVALDVTARSCHFARFNARLNALANVEVVQGDLYEPLAGRQFDCIVSHPPYVPALDDAMIYRDAGATGERLVRRVVEGLPHHLRPGGHALVVCLGIDTESLPFERRVLKWLGAAAGEFDVLFAVRQEQQPEEVVSGIAAKAQLDAPGLARLRGALAGIGASRMVYGALSVTRRASNDSAAPGHAVGPLRVRLGEQTTGADLARAHHWRRLRRQPGFEARIAARAPRLAPTLRVEATYAVEESRLVLAGTVLRSERPFPAAIAVPPWVAVVLGFVDGQRTFAQCIDAAASAGQLPEDVSPDVAGSLALDLLESGLLVVEGIDP